jgi:uroporphyrinogen-III decarboxylase
LINKLIDRILKLYFSDENKRRQSYWKDIKNAVRGEIQWHGIPKNSTKNNNLMPITADCLDTLWCNLFDLRLDRFFNEPEYYLKNILKIKIEKFIKIPDDTPIDTKIPIWFGAPFEASILGQNVIYASDEYPWLDRNVIYNKQSNFRKVLNFENNPIINKAKWFYEVIKRKVSSDFHVIFPKWFRGPQGVALYIRGYENFLTDFYLNKDFVHELLRFIVKVQKKYMIWRANSISEDIDKVDLFNDDIPLISPKIYETFILPYEQELANFTKGIYYWHSCGDITNHIPKIMELKKIDLLDIGVSVEDKEKAIKIVNPNIPLEIRVLASKYIQNAAENEIKDYMKNIISSCKKFNIKKYILRSSGMSVLNGSLEDLKKLRNWIKITRDVQKELIKDHKYTL